MAAAAQRALPRAVRGAHAAGPAAARAAGGLPRRPGVEPELRTADGVRVPGGAAPGDAARALRGGEGREGHPRLGQPAPARRRRRDVAAGGPEARGSARSPAAAPTSSPTT